MALGPLYCKQLKEELRRHAVFPPNRPIALGDYGVIRDHVFERLGNISQLGITFSTIPGTGQTSFQFKSKGKVDFSLIGKGDIQPGGVPAIRAGIELKFGRANAVFFIAAGCTVMAIDNVRAVEAALISLLNQGRWEPDFYVVTEVDHSARTTAIASADSNCEVKLDASSPAVEAIHLGDAALDLQIKRSRNTALEIVTEGGHIPLMQLARLRGLFRSELRPESAAVGLAGANFQLAPDPETAIPPGTPAISVRPGLESAAAPQAARELETTQFLRLAIESQPSDFELQRAINAYIPLLHAAYGFAHGNENPPVPDGFEIVAPIRTSSHEAAQAPEAISPEAREAVQNDMRAIAEEQRRGSPQAAAESIPFPDRFGFVFREKQTDSLIVSIRGTQTPEEWVKNFTAVPNPWTEVPGFGFVHLGFEQMWRAVRGSVFAALGPVAESKRITFLGHSLGGAMATLGTVDIRKNLNRSNVDLCTVGGPRVGLVLFRINFNNLISRCFRVVETRDIVPHVPPFFLGFNHVGLQINVRSKVDNAHSLDSYLEGLQNFGRPMEVAPLALPGLEAAPMNTLAVRVL